VDVRSTVAPDVTPPEAIPIPTRRSEDVVHASTVVPADAGVVFRHLTGALDAVLEGHTDEILALIMLSDGRLACGSKDRTIKLWNIHTRACEATLEGHTDLIRGLFHLRDGRLGSFSKDGTLHAWNVADGTHEVIRSGMGDIQSVVVLPDGRYAAACVYGHKDKRDNDIYVWRDKGEPYTFFKGHSDKVWNLVVLPDGNLAGGTFDGTIRIWSATTGECVGVIDVGMIVNHVVVLSNGRLACGSYYSHEVKVVNVTTGVCESVLPPGELGSRLTTLVALSHGRAIKVWNTTTGEMEVSMSAPSDIPSLCLLPDGRLASGGDDNMIRLWS
jgi:WD40 repeat protein